MKATYVAWTVVVAQKIIAISYVMLATRSVLSNSKTLSMEGKDSEIAILPSTNPKSLCAKGPRQEQGLNVCAVSSIPATCELPSLTHTSFSC